jgi:hypothetical protein
VGTVWGGIDGDVGEVRKGWFRKAGTSSKEGPRGGVRVLDWLSWLLEDLGV